MDNIGSSSSMTSSSDLQIKEDNNKLTPITLPVEEMFGSVTYNTVGDGTDQITGKGCQQLRTSARVIKKLKLDSNQTGTPDKIKDTTKDDQENKPIETKGRVNRPKVIWSQEDKTHFFDAIKEYGKDFDAIHDYIVSKCKKKGVAESHLKTKEQVRHFYYRTWHKVSKYLKFSDEVKKVVQEYYALINYGELRRKIGVTNEKTCVKLNELMYRGATQIRVRGKTVRIKTPMCRTLRRLNQIDDRPEDLKLPNKVLIELRPRDMDTWMYVQAMGQNPRVQCTMALQKRLHALISCLNSRWRTHEQRAYEQILNITNDCGSNGDDKKFIIEPILHVAPKPGTNIQIPTISYSELLTNCRISLNAYEERMCIKNRGEAIWLASINQTKNVPKAQQNSVKKGSKRSRNDSTGSETLSKSKKENDVNASSVDTVDSTAPSEVADIVDSVVNTILALSQEEILKESAAAAATTTTTTTTTPTTTATAASTNETIKTEEFDTDRQQLALETVRNGWTQQDFDTVSIGELYLMIGNDSKIDLEYWWETPNIKTESNDTNKVIQKNGELKIEKDCNSTITVVLQKLLSLAKLYYRKERIECPCGHVCGASGPTNKPTPACRSKITPQTLKNVHKVEVKSHLPEGLSTMEEVSLTSNNLIHQRSDGVFRLPIPPTIVSRQNSALEAFKAKLDSLRPKYCQRRGRAVRSKQVVVQRTLPLLPKTSTNDTSILTMKVIPQGSLASDFVPIAPKPVTTGTTTVFVQTKPTQHSIALSPIPIDIQQEQQQDSSSTITNCDETDLNIPPPSPTPTIGTLLDMELRSVIEKREENRPNSNILLENSNSSTFTDFLNENARGIETPLSVSPSRLLKDDDAQWLNSEVADFSLSSFLGHLETPVKTSTMQSTSGANEDSRMSQDVEAQLHSLMSENSIDYMAKFADLAAQVASSEAHQNS